MSTFFHPESFLAHCSDEMLHGIAHWAVTGCFPDGFNQQRHQNPGPIEIHIPQLSFTDPNIVAHIHLASDNDNHAKQFEKRGIEATRGDSPYTYLLGAYRSIDVLLDLIKKYPILLMASVLDNNNVSQTHGTTLLLNGMLSKKVPRVYRGAVIQMFFFEQLFHFSRKCDQAVEEILKIMKYEAISIASLLWAFENILKKVGSEEDKETFDKIVKPQIMPILSEIGKFPILSA